MSTGTIAERMKLLRERFGMSQKIFADLTGLKHRTLQEYEAGNRVPGGLALQALAAHGVNVNWVLTGEPPMWVDEWRHKEAQVDEELLKDCLAGVEGHLADLNKVLPPDKKALLVKELYMQMREKKGESGDHKPPAGELIARFVRLAS